MNNTHRLLASLGLAGMLCLLLLPGSARAASQPARTDTISAGAYIINVSVSKDPPFADEPFDITIVPRDRSLKLSGKVIMQPGSGTNGIELPSTLSASADAPGALQARVHIPVQGAWNIAIQLQGPHGSGQASIPVVVGAPGAMPPWIAWIIGASPLVFIAFWIGNQHRYRRSLVPQLS